METDAPRKEKITTPVKPSPGKKARQSASAKEAPALMPSSPESARGFLVTPCMREPAAERRRRPGYSPAYGEYAVPGLRYAADRSIRPDDGVYHLPESNLHASIKHGKSCGQKDRSADRKQKQGHPFLSARTHSFSPTLRKKSTKISSWAFRVIGSLCIKATCS